jgi:hypothetical protein
VVDVPAKLKRPTGLTGAAGEYFIAAELSLRGWLATVTIKNAPGVDVLAQNLGLGVTVAIQTKTASYGNDFQLNAKCEQPSTALNEWYVFVKLHEERTRPSFYVVPRNIVAGFVYATHREWLSRAGRGGRAHKDTTKRAAAAKYLGGYEDRWDLLDRPADQAPLLADQWYTGCVERFGLPPDHPGWPRLDAV